MMGDIASKVLVNMNEAVAAQPEGLEVMVTNKNAARLRQVIFQKATHSATTGSIDDLQHIMGAFDKLVPSLAASNLVSTAQLSKLKSLTSVWKKIRTYATVVHGVNLLLNRFPGKVTREKSALLREYKKAIERASLTVPRGLISWLQEECQ